MRYLYAHAKINEITDLSLLCLIDEVHHLRGTPTEGMVIQFLKQSLHPFGTWTPFDKQEFRTPEYVMGKCYMVQKLDMLVSSAVYQLCLDLLSMPCKIHGEPIEDHHGATLYVFLNRVLKDPPTKKRRPLV